MHIMASPNPYEGEKKARWGICTVRGVGRPPKSVRAVQELRKEDEKERQSVGLTNYFLEVIGSIA